jgi:poly-beta-1,6-N-acetyl-D-glucosamine synthase
MPGVAQPRGGALLPDARWQQGESALPAVDVVVAVFNESATIEGKLSDLNRLNYPRDRLRVLVVDGGSKDGTAEVALAWARGHDLAVEVLESLAVGKPAQLNAALARSTASWLLVTDADARLPEDALAVMVALATADSKVGLVGALVCPSGGHPLDQAHWRLANWLRSAERRFGTAGMVAGPCYLARRDLLGVFPPDTIADDICVSCRAAVVGARIEVAPVLVVELRAPAGSLELLRHKLRKATAYFREVLRFFPRPWMLDRPVRSVLLWRASLLLGPPLAVLGLVALAGARAGLAPAAAAIVLAVASGLVACVALRRMRRPQTMALVSVPVVMSLVLTAALLVYPFLRLSPRYRKVSLQADPSAGASV